jgi:light-regulated signal transduction histidine kinase (bacteriophytochrome)
LLPVHDADSDWVFALAPIEGGDWSLVLRVGADELYSQAWFALGVALAAIVLIMLFTGLILLRFMRPLARRAVAQARQLEREVKERTEAEEALRESEERLLRQTQDLVRSNRDLEQFAYIASHDLQEPLRMISGYTQLLTRRYTDRLEGEGREFMDYIVDGAKRMQTLINDLLSYSRVGTRGKPFGEVNCHDLLQRVLRDLGPAIEEHNAVIEHEGLPVVRGDEAQLGQLLQNLIGNSIKFHGEAAPRIRVSAHRQENQWQFGVKDNGIGIDPQYADRIFEIFQRLHTREDYPGTGIGLAVCRRIVERHGGKIWVESSQGEGATFNFTIPDQPPE